MRRRNGFAQYQAMADLTGMLDRIQAMLGLSVVYRGQSYRLAEVLEEPPRIVLVPTGPIRTILTDSYGHPGRIGPEFLELPVFADNGELSQEIRSVLLAAEDA